MTRTEVVELTLELEGHGSIVRDYGGLLVAYSDREFARLGVAKQKRAIRATLLLHGECPLCHGGAGFQALRSPARSTRDEAVYGFTCTVCGWGIRLGSTVTGGPNGHHRQPERVAAEAR